MIRTNLLITSAMLTLTFQVAAAEEITIAENEIRNLGVEFSAPKLAREVAAIEATARVVIPPMGDAVVSTPHAGLLAGLNVAVGEEVIRGQVVAKLQSAEFLELQREFLDALNANLLAQNEFDRDQQLFDEGIISGRRLQETTTRARIAATSFNEHRQLLQIAGLSESEIHSLETRQKLLQVLEIRAPFDGVIVARMAVAGERLVAMSPVYRLADLSSLWLEINVPLEKLSAVRPGMKVAVTGSPIELPAQVTTIGRSIDPATQAIMVRAALVETGHGLKPGQFVSARIVADHSDSSDEAIWVVPAAAVTRSGDSHFIFVRTRDGFGVRKVQVVSADTEYAYLRADIDIDTEVAIRGITTLKALWLAQSESST
jgi:cobalt-zinc-cadmium efflux system membrane fusion protein